MKTKQYIQIFSIIAIVVTISYLTYVTVRAYDNFVAEVEKKGYDKGYSEAKKDLKLEAVSKSNWRATSSPSMTNKLELVKKVAETFPKHKVEMVAVVIEESNFNPSATGYNCRYKIATKNDPNRELDKLTGAWINKDVVSSSKTFIKGYISTYCRKGQTNLAWSKDGGLLMINNPKSEDYNVDTNLLKAKSKYDTLGLNAWVAYSSGRYKENITEAKKLLAQI